MKKLKNGEKNIMILKETTRIFKINLTEIRLFGKVNSSFWNSKEIMLRKILMKLRENSNKQLSNSKRLKMKINRNLSKLIKC